MAKLRGKAKEEFLRRMARGRKKAERTNPRAKKKHSATRPKRANAAKPKRKAAKKAAKKKTAKKRNAKLTGRAKAEFLKRMARGRRKAKANPKRKKNPRGSTRRRRNQDDSIGAAAEKFTEFHGKPPGRIVEYEQGYTYPENLAEMGRLLELRIHLDALNPNFKLTGFKGTQAVCDPSGQNIYFIGGDQSIDFDALGISSTKDMVELGSCHYIAYHTVKGFHDFAPTDYHHKFGEESGVLPMLAYDRLNKTLFLLGGDFTVRPEGIVN